MAVQKCWIALLLQILVIATVNCSIFDPDAKDYGTELNSIDIDIKPGGLSVEYDNEGIWICPETFQLTFDLESKPFRILLVRAPGTRSTKLPIVVSEGKNAWLQDRKVTQQYCNYQDIYTSSSFTISLDEYNYILDGTFRKKGKLFGIRPKGLNSQRSKRSARGAEGHSLVFLSQDAHHSEMTENIHHRIKRNSKTKYEVEVLVYIDYSVYKRFENFTNWDATTEEKLAYHFCHILNEVSMRYAAIDDQDYEISVLMAGLVIAKTPIGSPWTRQSYWGSEIETLYDAFKFYLKRVLPSLVHLPSYDHAMLFTQKDLYDYDWYLDLDRTVVGMSRIGGVCSENSTSLVESNDLFSTAEAATHELGHNLGAEHDGRNNSCFESDMFVMTTEIKERSSWNYRNIYKFSSCSKRYFKYKLASISRSNSCLFNTTAWDSSVIKEELKIPPGQIYSLDEQCQAMLRDERSYFCGTQNDAGTICAKTRCWVSRSLQCKQLHDTPADQGTSCGYKRWCIDGTCVYNSSAPVANPHCLFGDSRKKRKFNCSETIKANPDLCSSYFYMDLCCASCGLKYYPPNSTRTSSLWKNSVISWTTEEIATDDRGTDITTQSSASVSVDEITRSQNSDPVGCKHVDELSICNYMSAINCLTYKDACCNACRKYSQAIEVYFGNKPNISTGELTTESSTAGLNDNPGYENTDKVFNPKTTSEPDSEYYSQTEEFTTQTSTPGLPSDQPATVKSDFNGKTFHPTTDTSNTPSFSTRSDQLPGEIASSLLSDRHSSEKLNISKHIGMKVGISVGVVGVIIIVGIIFIFVCFPKLLSKRAESTERLDMNDTVDTISTTG